MRTTGMLVVIVAVLTAAATPARAYDPTFEVSGFAGGHFFSDTNKLARHAGTARDFSLQHSGMVGFRVGFWIVARLSVEAELALIPTINQPPGDSVLAFGWRGQGLFHVLTGRVRPFILVGGGGFSASPSNPRNSVQDTRGEIHAGLGVKVDIRCNWGLRFDARVQFEPATRGIYFTEDWELGLALYGLFGRPIQARCTPPPPTPPTPPPPPQPAP